MANRRFALRPATDAQAGCKGPRKGEFCGLPTRKTCHMAGPPVYEAAFAVASRAALQRAGQLTEGTLLLTEGRLVVAGSRPDPPRPFRGPWSMDRGPRIIDSVERNFAFASALGRMQNFHTSSTARGRGPSLSCSALFPG